MSNLGRFSAVLLLALTLPGAGCDLSTVAPVLEDVFHAVDAGKAIECAKLGTAEQKAKCLGVVAMNGALDLALNKAADLSETARENMGPGGAGDMTDEGKQKLAVDLDEALGNLGHEIAEANAAAES